MEIAITMNIRAFFRLSLYFSMKKPKMYASRMEMSMMMM